MTISAIIIHHSAAFIMKSIISAKVVDQMLERLALEIIERNQGASEIVVLGIWQRGALLAERIVQHLNRIAETDLHVCKFDVNPFRDEPLLAEILSDTVSIRQKHVILVDDVLFSGKTIFAALQAIRQLGQPLSIQLAVLIDRGHRSYPIQPDYVGKFIPTKHKESIIVDENAAWEVFLEE